MNPATQRIEAAGGVLWRRTGQHPDGVVEVALVHRPKHDDWSLPKGKLEAHEHPLLGALREIEEETGFVATPGRPLGELRYLVADGPKRVRYWACHARAGSFRASAEVDELRWLPVPEALRVLPATHDGPVLARFAAAVPDTRPLLVVRHASAGDRDAWDGPDRDRPLDEGGQEAAAALVALLRAYRVARAIAADVARCRDTLAPFEAAEDVPVVVEPAVTAGRFADDPEAAVDALVRLAAGPPAVVCSQREVIADLVSRVARRLSGPVAPDEVGPLGKGAMVVLHLTDGPHQHDAPVLVAGELLPPA